MQFLIGALLGLMLLVGGLLASSQQWTFVDQVVSVQEVEPSSTQKEVTSTIPKQESSVPITKPVPAETKEPIKEQIPTEEKPVEEQKKPVEEPPVSPNEPVTSCEGHQEGIACVAFSQGATADGICRLDATGTLSCMPQ